MKTTIALLIALFVTGSVFGQKKEVPTVGEISEIEPGQTVLVDLEGEYKTKYFVRVPKTYGDDPARIIVFMHGSNMCGLDYLRSFEAAEWCEKDILVCPNGEQTNRENDPYGANNFSFSSANHVSTITKLAKEAFEHTRVYIGGHSQGGFLTYSCIMHFPELYDGAFPMAGDCWSQNEPNLWEDNPEKLAKQKRIPIAVIHGQADPVVNYSQGEHAHKVFLHMNYPKLRFFNPENLGHQFMLSPVSEALEWLDAMNGDNPSRTLELATEWGRAENWGWAHQAALALQDGDSLDDNERKRCEQIVTAMEKFAAAELDEVKQMMKNRPAEEWIPKWHSFYQNYGATQAAKTLVEDYETKRDEQRKKATELFYEGYAKFRESWKDSLTDEAKMDLKKEAYAKFEVILKETPCTYHAMYAIDWLEEREDQPKKLKIR